MPLHSPHLNASQTVERIREIIVGRHLERLESRVIRLESRGGASPELQGYLDDRLLTTEARLEALQQNFQRIFETSREELEVRILQQRSETQRLASQIQHVASLKSNEASEVQATQQLENKIGTWITTWQKSFNEQVRDRDERLTCQLRAALDSQAKATETRIDQLERRITDRDSLEKRFSRIAQAARALADSVSPMPLATFPVPHQ
jgi:uncharacterized protein YPO0396